MAVAAAVAAAVVAVAGLEIELPIGSKSLTIDLRMDLPDPRGYSNLPGFPYGSVCSHCFEVAGLA